MNFKKDHVMKALACHALLPPPGGEEVRKFAEDWIELRGLLDKLRDDADALWNSGERHCEPYHRLIETATNKLDEVK